MPSRRNRFAFRPVRSSQLGPPSAWKSKDSESHTLARPLTAGLLSVFIPEFASIDPTVPVELRLSPQLAPFTTGAPGPQGELATMQLPHLEVEIVMPSLQDPVGVERLVVVAVDARVGLDFGLSAGQVDVTIGGVVPGSLNVDIVENKVGTNEAALQFILEQLLAQALPTLADSFGGFPLPSLLGLDLGFVEASKNGEFISIFLDLSAAP